MADASPIDVACPTCQAAAGTPCTQTTDTTRRPVTWFHSARTDLASGWT